MTSTIQDPHVYGVSVVTLLVIGICMCFFLHIKPQIFSNLEERASNDAACFR